MTMTFITPLYKYHSWKIHCALGLVVTVVLSGLFFLAGYSGIPDEDDVVIKGEKANYMLSGPPQKRFVSPPIRPQLTPLASYLRVSHDRPILEALTLLAHSSFSPTVSHIQRQNGRIIFKDLKTIGKAYKNYDALSWISPEGQWMIFINHNHQSAPIEGIAAIIAHEAVHYDVENSLAEETAGWEREGSAWKELTDGNTTVRTMDNPLVQRLETIRGAIENNTLTSLVGSNPGYQQLQKTSKGFGS